MKVSRNCRNGNKGGKSRKHNHKKGGKSRRVGKSRKGGIVAGFPFGISTPDF